MGMEGKTAGFQYLLAVRFHDGPEPGERSVRGAPDAAPRSRTPARSSRDGLAGPHPHSPGALISTFQIRTIVRASL
jgi:hypothetical protein